LISVIQRVSQARVLVGGEVTGEIAAGLLVLLCAERGDSEAQADKLLAKILKLRIFADEPGAGPPQARPTSPGGSAAHAVANVGAPQPGKMNRSVQDTGGGLLVVSQFTLAADVSGGNRPSFTGAAAPEEGRRLYDYFVRQARLVHPVVQTGQFAADMQVQLVNDGPVTIPLRIAPQVQ
jgi:D-tyrosyl-tRNA(Tyr) deacylase